MIGNFKERSIKENILRIYEAGKSSETLQFLRSMLRSDNDVQRTGREDKLRYAWFGPQ